MDCPHFNNMRCKQAEELAGIDVPTTPPACSACSRSDQARTTNSVTVSLACSALRAAGQLDKREILLDTYEALLRIQVKLPTWAQQGWTLTGALTAFMTRPGLVSKETYTTRLAECDNCEQRNNLRCQVCGCYVHSKAHLPAEKCPVLKWDVEAAIESDK